MSQTEQIIKVVCAYNILPIVFYFDDLFGLTH